MTAFATYSQAFIEPIAMISLLVFLYGLISRRIRLSAITAIQKKMALQAVVGSIFAFCAVYAMIDPIRLENGVIFDIRFLFIGSATGLFGPMVGLVPLVVGILFRASLGGTGIGPGILSMILAFGSAWIWRRHLRHRMSGGLMRGVTLGGVISVHILGIMLLPQNIWHQNIATLAPFFVISNILGALLVVALLQREEELMAQTDHLAWAAYRDPLTGLLNRRKSQELYSAYSDDPYDGKGVALICFDLDGFKSINDCYGHAVGDQVLKSVAAAVEAQVRDNDQVGRIGGDEFVVLLHRIGPDLARDIAERCRKAVTNAVIRSDERTLSVTISVGCIWQRKANTFDDDLKRADRELYRAKATGKNAVSFAMHDIQSGRTEDRLVLVA